MEENLFIDPEEVDFIYTPKGPNMCVVSKRVAVDGMKIGFFYRDDIISYDDSGWTFFAGDEDEEYEKDPDNFIICTLNYACNLDIDILPYLNEKAVVAFEKDENGEIVKVKDWAPPVE